MLAMHNRYYPFPEAFYYLEQVQRGENNNHVNVVV